MANLDNMKLTLGLLQRVKDQQMPFSMEFWQAKASSNIISDVTSGDPYHKCGFVACVGGWMGQDPEHNALGFYTHDRHGSPRFDDGKETLTEFAAMAGFWGVSKHDAEYVTEKSRYDTRVKRPTIDDAMDRLRELIAIYEPQHETA